MLKRLILSLILTICPAITFATQWQLIPQESSINFTATQNNAPVTGEFKTFRGESNFDPAHLDKSNVKVIVEINSITASYSDLAETLKSADWFDASRYPQAIFTANHFDKMPDNSYQAHGTLTIREITMPITLTFTLKNDGTKVQAQGSTLLSRTQFGIGRGEWTATDAVKDEVSVNFIITATPKP